MIKQETFDRGNDAYWEGLDVADNPHQTEDEPDEHRCWEDGWREARKDDHDEQDW